MIGFGRFKLTIGTLIPRSVVRIGPTVFFFFLSTGGAETDDRADSGTVVVLSAHTLCKLRHPDLQYNNNYIGGYYQVCGGVLKILIRFVFSCSSVGHTVCLREIVRTRTPIILVCFFV